jgi:outer membrane protein assembly factor BamB
VHNAGSEFRAGAKKYYSAAASTPVITKSLANIYVADRDWYLSAMSWESGVLSWYTTNCLAVSASEDGETLYMRALKGKDQLQKWSLDGKLIWSSPIQLNDVEGDRSLRYTAPPVEKKGKVYTVSCWGTLYCVDSKTGKVLWQYQVTPQLAVMSSPVVDDNGIVYVSGMDGTVTAVIGK